MSDIQKVKHQIISWSSSFKGDVELPLLDMINTGKMVRARLVLIIAGESIKSIKLASIIEMIHFASLLHDDVIDESSIRRGESSVNARFGNKSAIMLGDLMYSKAYFELSNFEIEVIQSISNAVCMLSLGEMIDEKLGGSFNSDDDIYMDMIYKKTSSLIESSAYCAGIISNTNPNRLKAYGRNIGIAFQVVDDLLDIVASDEDLGKPSMVDFQNGKSTLPYIYLYKASNNEEKKFLLSCFKKTLDNISQNKLSSLFQKYGILKKTYLLVTSLIEKAQINADGNVELIKISKKISENVHCHMQ